MQRIIGWTLSLLLAGSCLPAFSQSQTDLTGTLIVLNKGGDNASFIDLASGEILATLPTGRNPHELIVTSDGRWAIGTNYNGGNSLTVFDVQNLAVARTIDLSDHPAPHGLLLMPGERDVIVTTEGSNEVVIVNFQTGEINRVIETGQRGTHMVAMSADGSLAYTANTQGDSVSVIDLTTGQIIRTLEVPESPEAIATNKAGSAIWVGSNAEGVVSVVDPVSGAITAQFDGFSWPYRILFTADERFVVMPDARAQTLRVFDVASGEEKGRLALPGRGPQGVTFYSDDRTLFLAYSARNRIAVIDIESMEILDEFETGSRPDGVGYSPLTLLKE